MKPVEKGSLRNSKVQPILRSNGAASASMSARELVFIGVGGIIGAGFFLGSGLPIRTAGPSVLLAFLLGAMVTSQVIGALTSVSVNHPVRGSFKVYADMYIGPFAGFLQGWTYYLTSILTIASESVAMSIFAHLWLPLVPEYVMAGVFALLILGLNAFGIQNFGKIESVMSAVKIAALVGFIMFAAIVVGGVLFGKPAHSGPVMAHAFFPFLPNGWSGLLQSMLVVIFAFAGIGVFGVAATEMGNAKKVDRAAISTVLILSLLYIGSITFVLILEPWSQVSTTTSPFVAALSRSGIPFLAESFNGIILIAAFSVMAGAVFSATQILISLGVSGEAPQLVVRKSKRGVHYGALGVTAVSVAATLAVSYMLPANVYNFLISASSFFTFFNWFVILWTFLRFRKRTREHDAFVSRLSVGQPYTTVGTMLFILFMTGYALFQHDERIGFYAFLVITLLVACCYLFVRRHVHIRT